VPRATLDGLNVFYRLEGADRPVVALSHSLGLDHGMWDLQLPALLRHFRVLRYDTRGHGATDAPEGDYTVELLARDALALLDRLDIDRVAWVGVSLGGFIGQWIASYAPDRLTRLVLANTTARIAEPAAMEGRRQTVLESGMAAIADTAMSRFFVKALVDANPPHVASARETVLTTNPVGYAGCCAALRDADLHELLPRIQTPTLVVSGGQPHPRRAGGPPGDGPHLQPRLAAHLHTCAAGLSRAPRFRRLGWRRGRQARHPR
jgi:3-oxoadipate enol-lactonase